MNLEIKKLDKTFINEIVKLENSSYESYYVKSTKEHLSFIFNKGFVYGAFHKTKLIAFSDACFIKNYNHKDWLSKVFIKNQKELNKNTIVFINTFVHKDYRGNNIQKILRQKIITEYNNNTYLTRIAQKNKASIKNIRSLGFKKLFHHRIRNQLISFYQL